MSEAVVMATYQTLFINWSFKTLITSDQCILWLKIYDTHDTEQSLSLCITFFCRLFLFSGDYFWAIKIWLRTLSCYQSILKTKLDRWAVVFSSLPDLKHVPSWDNKTLTWVEGPWYCLRAADAGRDTYLLLSWALPLCSDALVTASTG